MKMSLDLRLALEQVAAMCNDCDPPAAGDKLEKILGYKVDSQSNPIREQTSSIVDRNWEGHDA